MSTSFKMGSVLRIAIVAASLALVAGIVVYAALKKPPPQASAPLNARLELAAGEVTVEQGRGAERGSSGMALRSGAKVATATGARALVRLPDGSSIFLRDA